jgi:hypothetical protein
MVFYSILFLPFRCIYNLKLIEGEREREREREGRKEGKENTS